MAKKSVVASNSAAMSECIEKFIAYAAPRHIELIPATYGFYEVRKGNTRRLLGAVRAENADGVTGWIVNFADRERKFIADNDNKVFVGKRKYTPDECQRYRKSKKPA